MYQRLTVSPVLCPCGSDALRLPQQVTAIQLGRLLPDDSFRTLGTVALLPNRCPTFSTFRLPVSLRFPGIVTVALMRTLRWKAVSLNAATESGDFPHRSAAVHQSLTRVYTMALGLSTLVFGSPHRTRTCTVPGLSRFSLPIGVRSHGTRGRTRTYDALHVKQTFLPLNYTGMVHATGLEPVTPTMSRWCANRLR